MKLILSLMILLISNQAYSEVTEQDCITFGDSYYSSDVEAIIPTDCSDMFKSSTSQTAIESTESSEINIHGHKNILFVSVYDSLAIPPAFKDHMIAGEKSLLNSIDAIEINESEKKVLVLQNSTQSIMTYRLDIGGKIHPHKKLIADDLTTASNIALDLVNDQLIAIHESAAKLTFYHKDACIDGRIPEFSTTLQRSLEGALTELYVPVDACVSVTQNRLYVYDESSKKVQVFNASASGNTAPIASKTPTLVEGQTIKKINCHETAQVLILTDQTGGQVTVSY